MREPQAQVISFAIHNPHAPNIQCGVMVMINPDGSWNHSNYQRCSEPASMAIVEPTDDNSNRYYLAAFCPRHWEMKTRSPDESEIVESLADA